jgi:hypothetical protein
MGHCGFPECEGSPLPLSTVTEPHIGQEEADERRRIFERGRISIDLVDTPVARVLRDVERELVRAMRDFAPMHSAHEGHAVIREEFEELWEHVRANTGTTRAARAEAVQLAAMAVRYVLDVCDSEPVPL